LTGFQERRNDGAAKRPPAPDARKKGKGVVLQGGEIRPPERHAENGPEEGREDDPRDMVVHFPAMIDDPKVVVKKKISKDGGRPPQTIAPRQGGRESFPPGDDTGDDPLQTRPAEPLRKPAGFNSSG